MPGGMGGGLMGMLMKGAMGGMNRDLSAGRTQADPIADDYDLARWQRADGLDAVPTMVQTVRADWERREAEKQARSPIKRLFNRFSRKKKTGPAPAGQPESPPAGGTIVAPEMKKASQRINTSCADREASVPQTEAPEQQAERRGCASQNYLGLGFETELDLFFTANPVNSAILAVDRLGTGPLTLNQVTLMPEADALPEPSPVRARPDGTEQPLHPEAGPQNLIAQRADTNYMNEFHKSREQQKYNVRIRN